MCQILGHRTEEGKQHTLKRYAVFVNFAVKRFSADAQNLAGTALVISAQTENLFNRMFFSRFQRKHGEVPSLSCLLERTGTQDGPDITLADDFLFSMGRHNAFLVETVHESCQSPRQEPLGPPEWADN